MDTITCTENIASKNRWIIGGKNMDKGSYALYATFTWKGWGTPQIKIIPLSSGL
jgi:hypothetical protein